MSDSEDTMLTSESRPPSQSETHFTPLKITLSPSVEIGPIPSWANMVSPPVIDKDSSSVEITIPPLAEQTEIENFSVIVNFYDMGDGGPLIEKKNNHEEVPILLCSGLGINGSPVGLNSRTIAIPADLALDGGKILVRHIGRFDQLHSIILRPGRSAMVSVLSDGTLPAIIEDTKMINQELASGATPTLTKGDFTRDQTTFAQLSSSIEQFDGRLEFAFDLAPRHDETLFRTDIQGIDLEAHIEVELNGTSIGPLNIAPFQLDSDEMISTKSDPTSTVSLQLAGWRSAYIYIPNYLWKETKSDSSDQQAKTTNDEKNHLLLILKQGTHTSGSKIHLKNSCLELLHKKEESNL